MLHETGRERDGRGVWVPVAPRVNGRLTTPGTTGATEWDGARGSSPVTPDGAGSARSLPDPPRQPSARGVPAPRTGEHVDIEAAPRQLRPARIVRRWRNHCTGDVFLNVSKRPGGFRIAIDGDFWPGMNRGIEPDHDGTSCSARRQHSVIQDQIGRRVRRQRRQPGRQIERFELQMRGPVRPRPFQCQAEVTIGDQVEPVLRTGGRKTDRQSRSRRSSRSAGTQSSGCRSKPLWRALHRPDRGITRAPARSPSATRTRLAWHGAVPNTWKLTYAETGTTREVVLHIHNPISGEEIYRATDTYPAGSYDGKTETTVLCTGDRITVY